MVHSFGRKKIGVSYTGRGLRALAETKPLLALLICYLLGVIVSFLAHSRFFDGESGFFSTFDAAFDTFLTEPVLTIFIRTLKVNLCFETVIFLSGIGLFGVIGIPLCLAVYGGMTGCIIGFMVLHYQGADLIFMLLSGLAAPVVYAAALITIGKLAGFYSMHLLLYAVRKNGAAVPDLKKYLYANIIILIGGMLCAMTNAIFIKIGSLLQ